MKKVIIGFFLIASITNIFAQSKDTRIHSSTTLGQLSRNEIIQSSITSDWTYKVDKVCGSISQLITKSNETFIWESTEVLGLPKCTNDGKIRYQVFLSGITGRNFFLVNTETGKTWKMTNNKDGQGKWITSWIAFEE